MGRAQAADERRGLGRERVVVAATELGRRRAGGTRQGRGQVSAEWGPARENDGVGDGGDGVRERGDSASGSLMGDVEAEARR